MPGVSLKSIKAHHHVALDNFEAWVRIYQGLGNTPACSRADLSAYGMAICDFGSFDLIGHASIPPSDTPAVCVTAEVTGIAELVEPLKLRGHRIVLALHAVETGLRMLAVDTEGQLIEYLERRCGSTT